MTKNKLNEVVYHVLSHHIDHYIEAKKIFKTDYDSHIITITVFAYFLYGTLNPSHEKYQHEDLDWGEMYPLVKGLSKNKKKYLDKLSLFSLAQILDVPKETVRRKVVALCKKKQLEYSASDGVTIGDNWEPLAKKMAPKDLLSIDKAIKAIEKNGGISKILKNIKE
jgi:hypothetical protein|tara:strand:+ start:96 stop:593 length:498 start_codon:yes stop_codon:yes gene_type:complete